MAAKKNVLMCKCCQKNEAMPNGAICEACVPLVEEAKRKDAANNEVVADIQDEKVLPVKLSRKFADVPTGSISSGMNVRKTFDVDQHIALVDNIRRNGIMEPLLVAEKKNRAGEFILIAGERRLKAARALEIGEVPCMVYSEVSDEELYHLMITENLLRADLNAIEEAEGIKKLLDMKMSQESLSTELGKSPEWISNRLRLLDGPEELQQMIISKEITPTHALRLLPFTPYKSWPKFIEFYRGRNDFYKEHHDGASIPVSLMKDNFDQFLLECGGRTKTTVFADRRQLSDFPECKDCKKPINIGTGYQSGEFCFDTDCFKPKFKAQRAAKKAEESPKVPNGQQQFYHQNSWEFSNEPLIPADCQPCEKLMIDGKNAFCEDPDCFKKKAAAKKQKMKDDSAVLEKKLKSDAVTLLLGMTDEQVIAATSVEIYAFYNRDEREKEFFGGKKAQKDYTPEDRMRVYLFNKFADSFHTYSLYGVAEQVQFKKYADKHKMDLSLIDGETAKKKPVAKKKKEADV